VEALKRAWGVSAAGVNANFGSLNAVLMSDAHRPRACAALKEQLEKVWEAMLVPAADVAHVKRFCLSDATATNLAHLFYQALSCTVAPQGPRAPRASAPPARGAR